MFFNILPSSGSMDKAKSDWKAAELLSTNSKLQIGLCGMDVSTSIKIIVKLVRSGFDWTSFFGVDFYYLQDNKRVEIKMDLTWYFFLSSHKRSIPHFVINYPSLKEMIAEDARAGGLKGNKQGFKMCLRCGLVYLKRLRLWFQIFQDLMSLTDTLDERSFEGYWTVKRTLRIAQRTNFA